MCVCACVYQRRAGEVVDIQRIDFLFQVQTVAVYIPMNSNNNVNKAKTTAVTGECVCVCLPPVYECVDQVCVSLCSSQVEQRHATVTNGVMKPLSSSSP